MSKPMVVDDDVYDSLLKRKHEMESKLGRVVPFSDVIKEAIKK